MRRIWLRSNHRITLLTSDLAIKPWKFDIAAPFQIAQIVHNPDLEPFSINDSQGVPVWTGTPEGCEKQLAMIGGRLGEISQEITMSGSGCGEHIIDLTNEDEFWPRDSDGNLA